ncbi:Uncharacterised protein [Bordetella pertussis]|nr:Uncharacterised protein [Bordetella pertussis]CFW40761.1 Uncharacterised protein [Bordetella pertussis]
MKLASTACVTRWPSRYSSACAAWNAPASALGSTR